MSTYEKITNQLIELLGEGLVPWRRPWVDGPATRSYAGRTYRGINQLLLSAMATRSGLRGCWITFNQVRKAGGRIMKGAKGLPVVYWKWIDEKDKEGNLNGEKYPVCKYYTVFSVCQTEGIEEPSWVQKLSGDAAGVLEVAEAIWQGYENPPALVHGGDRAVYIPAVDQITLPARQQFRSGEYYYLTLFHEMIHSTGHPSRLARDAVTHVSFGSQIYCKEELVAEMGAVFLASEVGLGMEMDNSAAYIHGWIDALKGDSQLAVRAAAQAQRATDHILGRHAEEMQLNEG